MKGRTARGESARSKLTERDVIEIRESYSPRKVTLKSLSEKFGVTLNQIHLIVRRKFWKHI
jgi:predicted DNA binding protein